jgi:hypothetical protein
VQPHDARSLTFFEVTAHGVTHFPPKCGKVVCLGEDRLPKGPRDDAAFRCLGYYEEYFVICIPVAANRLK